MFQSTLVSIGICFAGITMLTIVQVVETLQGCRLMQNTAKKTFLYEILFAVLYFRSSSYQNQSYTEPPKTTVQNIYLVPR